MLDHRAFLVLRDLLVSVLQERRVMLDLRVFLVLRDLLDLLVL